VQISRIVRENDPAIKGREVRLIDADNQQAGILPLDKAFAKAADSAMDLVLVSDQTDPPVCRIMNFGKFLYERKRRARDQRKKQTTQKNKEIKFHANIDPHDYQIKVERILQFLGKGFRVKVSLFFRGREMARREKGLELMDRVANAIKATGTAESRPRMIGRSLTMMITPGTHK
jgi:translation initiation factor IF-3